MVKNSLFLCFIFFLIGCNNKTFETKEELLNFINDDGNGFSQTKKVNDIEINVVFKPTNLVVSQQMDGEIASDRKKDSLETRYNKLIFFNLNLSKDNNEILSVVPNSRSDFNILQNTLTFGMRDKVVLTTENKDTIPMIDYNYPRMYGMSKKTSLLFIFEKNEKLEKSAKLNFCLTDIGIGTGEVNFKFPASIIRNQPIISH